MAARCSFREKHMFTSCRKTSAVMPVRAGTDLLTGNFTAREHEQNKSCNCPMPRLMYARSIPPNLWISFARQLRSLISKRTIRTYWHTGMSWESDNSKAWCDGVFSSHTFVSSDRDAIRSYSMHKEWASRARLWVGPVGRCT